MSPKEKHIPDDAQRTSVCLTIEEKAAIRWISDVRTTMENNGIGWTLWDYADVFGIVKNPDSTALTGRSIEPAAETALGLTKQP